MPAADLLTIAREYLANGLCVVPAYADKKHPCILWTEYQTRLPTDAELVEWFGPHRTRHFANVRIGMLTGAISGVVVIEWDPHNGAQQSFLAKFFSEREALSGVHNGVRGHHLYFEHPGKPTLNDANCFPDFPGVDVRGDGGFVMLPPSPHYSGVNYEWLKEGPLSPLPAALFLPRYSTATGDPESHTYPTEGSLVLTDEQVESIVNAMEWAETGKHYQALALTGALLKAGVSQQQTLDVVTRACGSDDRKVLKDHRSRLDSTVKRIQHDDSVVGTTGLRLDDESIKVITDILHPPDRMGREYEIYEPEASTTGQQHQRIRVHGSDPEQKALSLQDLENLPPLERLIENGPGLALRSHTALISPANEGKSLTALDISLRLALGLDWYGHKSKQSPVFYLAAEFPADLEARIKALLHSYSIPYEPSPLLEVRFWVYAFSLCSEMAVQRLAKDHILPFFKDRPGLIVADTLSALFGGEDENSPEAMGNYVHNVRWLIHKCNGSAFLTLHHPPKSSPTVERGHSSFRGDVDCSIALTNTDTFINLEVTKMRYAAFPTLPSLRITTTPVTLKRGETVEAAYITSTTYREREDTIDDRFWKGDLPEKARQMYDILREIEPVSLTDWFSACSEKSFSRATLFRHKKRLAKYNYIDFDKKARLWSTATGTQPQHVAVAATPAAHAAQANGPMPTATMMAQEAQK